MRLYSGKRSRDRGPVSSPDSYTPRTTYSNYTETSDMMAINRKLQYEEKP